MILKKKFLSSDKSLARVEAQFTHTSKQMNKCILGLKVISEDTVSHWLIMCEFRLQVLGDFIPAMPSSHEGIDIKSTCFLLKIPKLKSHIFSVFDSMLPPQHNVLPGIDPALHFSSNFPNLPLYVLEYLHHHQQIPLYLYVLRVFPVPLCFNSNLIVSWRYHFFIPQRWLLFLPAPPTTFLMSLLPLPGYYLPHLPHWCSLLTRW